MSYIIYIIYISCHIIYHIIISYISYHMSYHIMSYHIISYHVIYHIIYIMSCHIIYIIYHIIYIISYHVIIYIMSCHIIYIISYISYHVMSYIMSYVIKATAVLGSDSFLVELLVPVLFLSPKILTAQVMFCTSTVNRQFLWHRAGSTEYI